MKVERAIRESDNVTDDLRFSGRVRRYATWPTIQQQTVGDHCWGVYRVYCELWGALPSAEVAYYVMHHDSAELVTGDPPFPFKRDNPDVKAAYDRAEAAALDRLGVDRSVMDVGDVERARVKVCDLLEMYSFGLLERELGNCHAVPIVERTRRAALEHAEAKLGHAARMLVHAYAERALARHRRVMQAGRGAS